MLTPIEIQNKTFKTGLGYDKKDVDAFFKEVSAKYEHLYKENVELNDKIGVLSEGIQYYKSIEKTLQKALVLAERTSDETKESALIKAKAIEEKAELKAKALLADAEHRLNEMQLKIMDLIRQYDMYKAQFKQLAATQIEFLNSDSFQIEFANVNAFFRTNSEEETKKESKEDGKVSDKMDEFDSFDIMDNEEEDKKLAKARLDALLDEVMPKVKKNTTRSPQRNEAQDLDDTFEYIEVED